MTTIDTQTEIDQQLAEATPEFMAAMGACLRLVETLGQDHPETTRALQRAMLLAPPSMHEFMGREAQALGLVPDAAGYTEEGEPVFTLAAIAAKLEISVEEAEATLRELQAGREELGLPSLLVDPARVHGVH